jgi:coenzyme F420-reducing hydrogenase alpha subunit
MPAIRTIEVKTLSRVEGEGALLVKLDGDRVEQLRLNIYEPPRFFEAFLRGREVREVPDLTARICGICPVAYQMSSCHALEKALGMVIPHEIRRLRRLLYCAEWIESHALHIYLLHAPDFLGFESGISLAAANRAAVEKGLRIKKIGNALIQTLGGRAIHPINVAVGGFHRAPDPSALNRSLPDLEWGLEAAIETLRWVSQFDFPDLEIDYEMVSVKHPYEYPLNEGRVVSSSGLDIAMEEYEKYFEELQVEGSNALHSVILPERRPYLVGPLARFNLCFDQLSQTARREAEACHVEWPCRNNFKSIVARAVELIHCFEESIAIIKDYQRELTQSQVVYNPAPGSGCHATEAPRGLLYHRYRIGDDGLIAEANIVPPTSQNLFRIEEDLRVLLPKVLGHDDREATRRCEHMIRNYDPCISCATHAFRMKIER